MARKKKSMIGFDPLAWLGDDSEDVTSENAESEIKAKSAKKKSVKKKTAKKKAVKKTKEKPEVKEVEEVETAESIEGDVLTLSGIQDISKSESLKEEMLDLVKDSKQIKIDASDVGRIDGSALQLLCGLFSYAKSNDIELSWIDPSDAMMASAEHLGVKDEIGLDYFGLF